MEWWRKMASPVKRIWLPFATRLRSRKTGRGILELHNDVQMCGYRDVEVMWEMLRLEIELEHTPRRHKRHLWRVFAFFDHCKGIVGSRN